MSHETLTIPFANAGNLLSDVYWIRLEQLKIDETVTLAEAAKLVDSVFDLDPCVEPEAEEEEETSTESVPDNPEEVLTEDTFWSAANPPVPVERDAFKDAVLTYLPMEMCKLDAEGNWVAQVKVIISNPGEQYTLRLDNGEVLGTVVVEEQRNDHITIEDVSGVVLDYPVVGGGTFEFGNSATSSPKITRVGNTLNWGEVVTGSLTAQYTTRYDLVDILVSGTDECAPGECQVLGFYHGMVDELDLEIPEDEGDDIARGDYCGVRTHFEFPGDTPGLPQWITVETMYYCVCSGEYDHSKYTHQPTAADMAKDPPENIFPGITKVEDGGFVDCNEKDESLSDPYLYEEICCHPPDVNLPDCIQRHAKNPGKKLDPDVQKSLIEQYGDKLQVTYLMPSDGDCGTDTYHQKLLHRNCCEDVLPLSWNEENSIETIGSNDSGWIFVEGGKGPYIWKVIGEGFFFQGGQKQITTTGTATFIYTIDACGMGWVTVEDVCDQAVNAGIRCTNGSWVFQGEQTPESTLNVVCGVGTRITGGITYRYELIDGGRKTDQSYTHRSFIAPPTYNQGNYCGYCQWSVNCLDLTPEGNCTRCVTGDGMEAFPHYCDADTYSNVPCTWDNPPEDGFVDMYTLMPGGINVYVWECS